MRSNLINQKENAYAVSVTSPKTSTSQFRMHKTDIRRKKIAAADGMANTRHGLVEA